jgi:hypothetical protein
VEDAEDGMEGDMLELSGWFAVREGRLVLDGVREGIGR